MVHWLCKCCKHVYNEEIKAQKMELVCWCLSGYSTWPRRKLLALSSGCLCRPPSYSLLLITLEEQWMGVGELMIE